MSLKTCFLVPILRSGISSDFRINSNAHGRYLETIRCLFGNWTFRMSSNLDWRSYNWFLQKQTNTTTWPVISYYLVNWWTGDLSLSASSLQLFIYSSSRGQRETLAPNLISEYWSAPWKHSEWETNRLNTQISKHYLLNTQDVTGCNKIRKTCIKKRAAWKNTCSLSCCRRK